MSLVHYYNPGYEASLTLRGGRCQSYTPPKNVSRLRRDLATLPYYFMAPEERVLVPKTLVASHCLPQFVTALTPSDQLLPWGWSPELASLTSVPYADEEMLYLGSRLPSLELFELMQKGEPESFLFNSNEANLSNVTTERAIPHFAPRLLNPGDILPEYPYVLKRLYSSSGRGVTFHINSSELGIQYRGKDPIIVEPLYEKIEDLGFEFRKEESGAVTYLGLSLFETHVGRYVGNKLGEARRKNELELGLSRYITLLTSALEILDLRSYTGLLGVDTLTYRTEEGHLAVAPVIEVNVRPTMGHIALALEARYPWAKRLEILYGVPPPHLTLRRPLYLYSEACAPGFAPQNYFADNQLMGYEGGYSSVKCHTGEREEVHSYRRVVPLTPIDSSTAFVACLFY